MIQYVLECIAFQLVFLAIYDFWLKRETFFQWNRVYLIGTYLLSMILPWVKIEAFRTEVPTAFQGYPEFLWNLNNATITVTGDKGSTFAPSWELVLLFSGMILTTVFFAYKLFQISKLKRLGEVHYFNEFTRVILPNSTAAFSFLRAIFLGDKVVEREHDTIIKHELVHIRQRHSYDLIFFELMRILGWFNPLVYVYQNRISELHEFIADAHTAKTHKKEQVQLLLSQVFQTRNISFINQFFKKSLIKKRIVMLQKSKSKQIWKLKYLLLMPLVLSMLFYTSCQNEGELNSDEAIIVADIENLSQEEEGKVFDRLKNLSQDSDDWLLLVKDGNSIMRFIPSKDETFLTGPNNEKIYAKLAIDSRFIASADQSSKSNPEAKYHELLAERGRLVEVKGENDPVISSLDQQMQALKEHILAENDGTVSFAWTDEAPIFPGCEGAANSHECFQKSIQEHIRKHFNYPEEAIEKGLQGRVNALFTITSEGNIEGIRLRGPDEILEDEVQRIIKRLPIMKAGMYKGKAVNVPFSIPISFKLK